MAMENFRIDVLSDKLADVLVDRGTGWVKLHRVSPEAADLIERLLLAHGAKQLRTEDCVNATHERH